MTYRYESIEIMLWILGFVEAFFLFTESIDLDPMFAVSKTVRKFNQNAKATETIFIIMVIWANSASFAMLVCFFLGKSKRICICNLVESSNKSITIFRDLKSLITKWVFIQFSFVCSLFSRHMLSTGDSMCSNVIAQKLKQIQNYSSNGKNKYFMYFILHILC